MSSVLFLLNFYKKGDGVMLNLGVHTRGEIEIIEPKLVFENKFVDVYNDAVVFPSGNKGTYVRVNVKPTKSVAVLPITNSGEMVVVKNYRHGVRGWGLEIPKGAVEEDEIYFHAVARELKEETGYVFDKLIHIGEYSESPAVFGNKISCFVATNCSPSGERIPEKTEAISDVLEMSVQDFLREKTNFDYVDALTEMVVCKYLLEGVDIDEQ